MDQSNLVESPPAGRPGTPPQSADHVAGTVAEVTSAVEELSQCIVEIAQQADNSLAVVEPGGVQLSFFGNVELQAVAEPTIAPENGVVVASVYDLAATKAKAIVDRSEWRDYVDIAALLRAGHRLADIIGYAAAVFDRRFAFPTPAFLRSLVWFEDGTAPDVPEDVRRDLEGAVRALDLVDIPRVEPYRTTITP